MNTAEISSILRRRCRNTFVGVFASDRLPSTLPAKRPLILVCNTDPHDKPGKHWVVLYLGREGKAEYFDSLHEAPPSVFKKYLEKNSASWTGCSRQLQSAASQFCGHYCIFYCLFRSLNYSMKALTSCFSHDTGMNDIFTHAFICKLLK